MACGLLLWVSCICALLLYVSSASIAKKGYRYSSDALNLDEEDDDDRLMAERSDPEPNDPSVNQVGGPVNGMAQMWKQEDLNKPLTFPLRNQAGQSSWSALTNAMADPPSNQDSAYASQSSSRVSQLSPYSSGMRNGNGLVYEQVFQYSKGSDPSQGYSIYGTGSDSGQATYPQESSRSYDSIQEMPSFHFQTNTAAYPSGMENQSSGPTGYYQRFFQVPQKAVSWGVSDPVIPPAPPPPSYITQSRNGYERMRYSHTHTKYSPDPYAPTPMSQDTKAPPPQQADPGVAKEPQRTKW